MNFTLLGTDYASLVDFREQFKILQEGDSAYIDLSLIDFMRPEALVILSCIIEELHCRKITVTCKNQKNVAQYLETINFFDYWKKDFNRDNFNYNRNSNYVGLWKVKQEKIYDYANYAQLFFSRFFPGKDLSPFYLNLSEVFNNIFDHSQSPIDGFVITQYYEKRNRLKIAICDFGIGIPTKINNYRLSQGKNKVGDLEAIELSLVDKFSTKSQPRNKGLGLNTILRDITASKGYLKIISNNGFLFFNDTSYKKYKLAQQFEGTLIIIELDTRTLEDKEKENEDLFDW